MWAADAAPTRAIWTEALVYGFLGLSEKCETSEVRVLSLFIPAKSIIVGNSAFRETFLGEEPTIQLHILGLKE